MMKLKTYEMTHRILTQEGLSVSRARDLMSILTIMRLDGASMIGDFNGDRLTIVVHDSDEDLIHACRSLANAKKWITVSDMQRKNIAQGDVETTVHHAFILTVDRSE